jgi:hypothetical protein
MVGSSDAPDQADAAAAKETAFTIARKEAQSRAFADAEVKGREAGALRGRSVGEKAGHQDGVQRASGRVDQRLDEIALAEEAAAATVEPLPGTAGSDVCVAFQDYVPGVGCVPPVAPGETQAPISCPPGTVPAGSTGACGRP